MSANAVAEHGVSDRLIERIASRIDSNHRIADSAVRMNGPTAVMGEAMQLRANADLLAEALEAIQSLERRLMKAEPVRSYAQEATKALTSLAGGGSENFGCEMDGFYKADIPRCVARISDRFATAREIAARRGIKP